MYVSVRPAFVNFIHSESQFSMKHFVPGVVMESADGRSRAWNRTDGGNAIKVIDLSDAVVLSGDYEFKRLIVGIERQCCIVRTLKGGSALLLW